MDELQDDPKRIAFERDEPDTPRVKTVYREQTAVEKQRHSVQALFDNIDEEVFVPERFHIHSLPPPKQRYLKVVDGPLYGPVSQDMHAYKTVNRKDALIHQIHKKDMAIVLMDNIRNQERDHSKTQLLPDEKANLTRHSRNAPRGCSGKKT